jgi:hypothetical protein
MQSMFGMSLGHSAHAGVAFFLFSGTVRSFHGLISSSPDLRADFDVHFNKKEPLPSNKTENQTRRNFYEEA